ncbi:hypothetical protein BAE44_0009167 [Dichanthelium oligosanthes]|uniref:Glycosyltransferase 61 catalytic domain-containing protein n=1 Tax=Dichanthelium oligosanthes TaxID=888268 RepID=A0A1E5VXI5_9POAL|nr:hypothetical protein BAE44_0009167 [Dichanthelium oligosanthes]
MRGRHKSKKHGGALWLLVPLLVLIVLKTNLLPQVARSSIVGSPPSAALSRNEMTGSGDATKDVAAPIVGSSKLTCNFSNHQSNTCAMEGDLRIHGKSATVHVVSASTYQPENSTIKLRPYARKWEDQVMLLVREVTIQSSPPAAGVAAGDTTPLPPECSVQQDVPAVVFSTGGYNRNFFHVMTDVIIPLYLTAHEYGGRVQLLATDYEPKWIAKYKAVLAALSAYPVVDMDSEDTVRCFPAARVGLESHKELGIVPGVSPNGYTMGSFRDFIRSAYSLRRRQAAPVSRSSGRKPRLVLILRRNSRQLKNEADAIAAATEAGFEVVAADPDDVGDLERFSGVVNSCDVLMGVHGAGLANMLFLPDNATVVQIIPWGELKWPCRHSFGDPVAPMGLRYLEYEATAAETTLNETYPRDHAVFTDPLSIHRQGFDKVWNIFINGQHVILDIKRFRGFMDELYQSVTT